MPTVTEILPRLEAVAPDTFVPKAPSQPAAVAAGGRSGR
jgi:hypothetical protein